LFRHARKELRSPEGQQFVVVTPVSTSADSQPSEQQINVVMNWFEELKRLVPTN
jgi:hypothetical protein